MKVQSGIRFDKMTLMGFKELCKNERFKVNEILEGFMKKCLKEKTTWLWKYFDTISLDDTPEIINVKLSSLIGHLHVNMDRLKRSPSENNYRDDVEKNMIDILLILPDATDTFLIDLAKGLLKLGEPLLRLTVDAVQSEIKLNVI